MVGSAHPTTNGDGVSPTPVLSEAPTRRVQHARTMTPPIPLWQADLTPRDADAAGDALVGGLLFDGPCVEDFERRCATITGRAYAVAVSTGADALRAALVAAGVGPGDEVVTTSFGPDAASVANAILACGATPAFADVDLSTLNADAELVEARVNDRTRAVVATLSFGHPHGLDRLEQIARRNELVLIEDARAGLGGRLDNRPVGGFGRASVIGVGPGRQISGVGDGGAVVTDDDRLAATCRSLRDGGRDSDNSRKLARASTISPMSEVAAAVACSQLDRLEAVLERYNRAATGYMGRLLDDRSIILPTVAEGESVSWSAFALRLNDLFEPGDRDLVVREMARRNVGCAACPPPVHNQPFLTDRPGYEAPSLPMCESTSERTLLLPLHAGLTEEHVGRVCDALGEALEKTLLGRKGRM